MTKAWLVVLLVLLASVAQAATIYVDGSLGGDCVGSYNATTRACSGGSATADTTIAGGFARLSSGDTLDIRAGTYAESFSLPTIPSGGGSWATATTIQGHAGETVTVSSSAANGLNFGGSNQSYIIFDHLTWDGAPQSTGDGNLISIGTVNHIRFSNSIIKNGWQVGIQANALTDTIEILNNDLFNNGRCHIELGAGCGQTDSHGVYIAGDNTLVQGNTSHGNSHAGIQLNDSDFSNAHDNRIVGNRVYDNGVADPYAAIIVGSGTNNLAANNIVYATGSGVTHGIQVSSNGPIDTKVYNNTCYGTLTQTCFIQIHGTGTEFKNNIADCVSCDRIQVAGGSAVTATANLCDNADAQCQITSSDPLFVSAGTDFHLQAGSPARDAGTSLAGVVDTDFAGSARPQGGVYDIGAYEFYPVPGAPTDVIINAPPPK